MITLTDEQKIKGGNLPAKKTTAHFFNVSMSNLNKWIDKNTGRVELEVVTDFITDPAKAATNEQ
ncbi:MAG: hypothetical protein JKY52_17325 [Flavobacteriales bacterium]|nr:hypothetical protein [Flavobacteriales bacterium]